MKQCKNKVRDMHVVERKYIDSGNHRQHNISTFVLSMLEVAVVHFDVPIFFIFLILLQCDLYYYCCFSNRCRSKLMGGKSRRQMKVRDMSRIK